MKTILNVCAEQEPHTRHPGGAALDIRVLAHRAGGAVAVARRVLQVSVCIPWREGGSSDTRVGGQMGTWGTMGRFSGFLLSCLVISLAAARGRGIKSGATLLGVGVV